RASEPFPGSRSECPIGTREAIWMNWSLFPRAVFTVVALAVGLGALGVPSVWADVRSIPLPTNDLVYDRFSGRIYASVPLGGIHGPGGATGGVVAIDPESGTVAASMPLDGGPGRLAISDDGRYLYVALDEAGAVRRLDLPAMTPGLQFSLGGSAGRPDGAEDMAVMPSHPESLAVARAQGGMDAGIAIYDNGMPRPVSTPASGQDG